MCWNWYFFVKVFHIFREQNVNTCACYFFLYNTTFA